MVIIITNDISIDLPFSYCLTLIISHGHEYHRSAVMVITSEKKIDSFKTVFLRVELLGISKSLIDLRKHGNRLKTVRHIRNAVKPHKKRQTDKNRKYRCKDQCDCTLHGHIDIHPCLLYFFNRTSISQYRGYHRIIKKISKKL